MAATQNAAVPQSWFSHFYALGSACNLAVSALLVSQLASQPAVQPHQVQALPTNLRNCCSGWQHA